MLKHPTSIWHWKQPCQVRRQKTSAWPFVPKNRAIKNKRWLTNRNNWKDEWNTTENYIREYLVADEAIDAIPQRPTIIERDKEPSEDMEEHSKTLDTMSSGKAPNKDAIPADFWNVGRTFVSTPSSSVVVKHVVFHKTWRMQLFQHSTKTKVIVETATISEIAEAPS